MSNPIRRRRRGSILIVALLCLLVVMSLLGTMLLAALQASRQLHAERDLRQCELLLQAGVDQALARIARQPDYTGETRDLAESEIINQGAGRITIVVKPATADAPPQLQVAAEYPAGSEFAVRRSRTLSIQSNPN